jgi:hypothetical protein
VPARYVSTQNPKDQRTSAHARRTLCANATPASSGGGWPSANIATWSLGPMLLGWAGGENLAFVGAAGESFAELGGRWRVGR